MKKKSGLKYFKREWKAMESHLQSFLKKEEQDDLHQFRIHVKRLLAFLLLLDRVNHHSKLAKLFRPLHKVFKKAGELRDRYIMRKLIPGQSSSCKSLKKLRSLVDGRRKKIKKAGLEIIRKIKPVKRVPIQRFYKNRLQGISGSLTGVVSDDRLHKSRKQIKGLLYNYKPFCDILHMHLNTGYLEQLEEAIGKWHDQLMIRQLSAKYQSEIRHMEENSLANLRSDITRLVNYFYQRALFMTDKA